jgi:transposase InsO family protein
VPKDIKLWVINLIEASPLKKKFILNKLGMHPCRYFRWCQKYYLDNSLDDKRGLYRRNQPRLEDIYRKHIVDARKNKFVGKAIIGPERIVDELEKEGIFLSHETVRKILHQEGLIEPRPKIEIHDYKRFEAEKPNLLWQIDILYLFIIGYGYYYLFSILDDHSRKILFWHLTPFATAKEAVYTVHEAIQKVGLCPLKIITDHGIQFYTGEGKKIGAFEIYLKSKNIEHSLARVRHPQTMGKIERYHRSLRQECLNHYQFDDPIETRRIIAEYIDLYNYIRKHKGIGRVTPHQRYSGQDKLIRINRLKLRNQILLLRKAGWSENYINQEVAIRETVANIKSALNKEVVLI